MSYTHNAFGLTTDEVVAAYLGTTYNDYGINYDDGLNNITLEIENQEAKILNVLDPYLVKMLEYVILEEVCRTTYVGQTTFNFGLTPDISGATNFVYVTADQNYVGNLFRTDVWYNQWFNYSVVADDNALPDGFQVPFTYSEDGTQGILASPMIIGQVIYATYAVDLDNLFIPSLKAVLKDQVVSALGFRLYSSQNQVWGLVEKYQKDADAGMARISVEGYLPAEIKRMRWFKTPFRTSNAFGTLRLKRG